MFLVSIRHQRPMTSSPSMHSPTTMTMAVLLSPQTRRILLPSRNRSSRPPPPGYRSTFSQRLRLAQALSPHPSPSLLLRQPQHHSARIQWPFSISRYSLCSNRRCLHSAWPLLLSKPTVSSLSDLSKRSQRRMHSPI